MAYIYENINLYNTYFDINPDARLYGEWLVPHTLKTYRDEAWRKFYVFDVMVNDEYLTYDNYVGDLKMAGIDYVPRLIMLRNALPSDIHNAVQNNTFLIKDNEGVGEGIVIKNYSFENKYGRKTWAKIVTNEFKDSHRSNDGEPKIIRAKNEEDIVSQFLTEDMIKKTYFKVTTARGGWTSEYIPQLLNTVFHDFVVEETWNICKKLKNPNINFADLKHYVILKIKDVMKEVF
jgi:hypothetical protein